MAAVKEEGYEDPRQAFWKHLYQDAADYETYLGSSDPERARRWREMGEKLPRPGREAAARLQGHNRTMHVLISSGVWCGDCARQGPMIHALAETCGPRVQDRWIDREASAQLRQELRMLGGKRVPVAVFLSEDFFEIGRFGDRMLAAYRAKAAREFGPACDAGIVPPPPEQLAAELQEWADIFERMLLMLRLSPQLRARHGD